MGRTRHRNGQRFEGGAGRSVIQTSKILAVEYRYGLAVGRALRAVTTAPEVLQRTQAQLASTTTRRHRAYLRGVLRGLQER